MPGLLAATPAQQARLRRLRQVHRRVRQAPRQPHLGNLGAGHRRRAGGGPGAGALPLRLRRDQGGLQRRRLRGVPAPRKRQPQLGRVGQDRWQECRSLTACLKFLPTRPPPTGNEIRNVAGMDELHHQARSIRDTAIGGLRSISCLTPVYCMTFRGPEHPHVRPFRRCPCLPPGTRCFG